MPRALELAAAFLVALAAVALQTAYKGVKAPETDELAYLSIAHDLNMTGVFSDGLFAEPPNVHPVQPGRFFPPAYPLFLHLMSVVDPAVRASVACNSRHRGGPAGDCRTTPMSILAVQAVMAAIGLGCIFAIAFMLSGSSLVAWLTLALALATGKPGYYARTYLTENVAFLWFYVFAAAAVAAVLSRRAMVFALAGAALALAALSRPSYLYLIYCLGAALLAVAVIRPGFLHLRLQHAAAFALAAAAVLAPWMLRNFMLFGDPAVTAGYGGFILVQRVAYNAMTWTEWGVSLIAWLPDFGDALARVLFPAEAYIRLGWHDPTAFYVVGNRQLLLDTLEASGGRAGHLGYLMKHHVLGDPINHLAVTLPLTLRGIWVGKYLSLAGVALALPVAIELARRKRLLAFMVLAVPPLLMAGLHGLISVNVTRYNVPLVALYAFVVAFAIVTLAERRGWVPEAMAGRARRRKEQV